jgi:hypothetical protein
MNHSMAYQRGFVALTAAAWKETIICVRCSKLRSLAGPVDVTGGSIFAGRLGVQVFTSSGKTIKTTHFARYRCGSSATPHTTTDQWH